ncbi:MAG: hypothetical protein EAX96_20175 [Candidatus Lokiarchaeota archaeon]|nr:hypothetical protein [Candidatus Lokiarchaeota archaeon]
MNEKHLSQRFFEGVFFNFIGSNIVLILNTFSSFLIIYILSISDYGYYQVGFNLIFFFNLIASLGISGGVLRFIPEINIKNKFDIKNKFIKQSLLIGIISRLLIYFTCILFSLTIFSNIFPILFFISIIIIPSFFQEFFLAYLKAHFKQLIVNIIQSIYSIIYFLLIIISVFFFQDLFFLIGIYILAYIIDVIMLVGYYIKSSKKNINFIKVEGNENNFKNEDQEISLKKIWYYNIFLYIINVLNFILIWRIDNILVLVFGATIVQSALISFTNSFNQIVYASLKKPLQDITQITGTEFLTKDINNSNLKDNSKYDEFFKKVFKATTIIFLPIFIIAIFLIKYFIILILPKYIESVIACQLAIFFMIFYSWGDIIVNILFIIKKLGIVLFSHIIIILKIALIIIFIPIFGPVNGMIISTGITILLTNIFMFILTKRYVKIEFPKIFILKMTLIGSLMSIQLFLVDLFQDLILTCIIAIISVGIYLILLRILKVLDEEDKKIVKNLNFPIIKYVIKII